MVSEPTFEQAVRKMWEMKPKLREVPSDAGFQAYREAVKRRLASHPFTRAFRLEDDPRQQGDWTTWVEYLNFEYWQADRQAASFKGMESHYHDAWDSLQRLDYPSSPALGRVELSSSGNSSPDAPFEQQLATA